MCTGFKAAKKAVVTALREGNYLHEARDTQAEKNLLAVGDIKPKDVARLVLRTASAEYSESPHHADRTVVVHTFRPMAGPERWYSKAYFLAGEETATFISVHRTE